MKVMEAKKKGLIPKGLTDYVPNECECGAPLEISENFRIMRCSSYDCYIKKGYRASLLLENIGIKGLGPKYCINLMKRTGAKSHLAVLLDRDALHGKRVNHLIQKTLTDTPMTYKEAVSKLGLPGLQTKAHQLFKGINSYDDMVNDITRNYYGSAKLSIAMWVARQLGQEEPGIEAWNLTETIVRGTAELRAVTHIFNIIPEPSFEYRVAVTGRVFREVTLTRPQFENYCRDLAEGKVDVIFTNSTGNIDYVIADSPSSSRKYREGMDKGIIITSSEFCDKIREGVRAYDREEE